MPLFSLSISQLILAFFSASILQKLTYNRFFLHWLASHKFVCLLVPSNQDLRNLRSRSKDKDHGSAKKGSGKKLKKSQQRKEAISRKQGGSPTAASSDEKNKDELFKIASNDLDSLKLQESVVQVHDLEQLTFAIDLEWIVDLSMMSIFSFIVTEIQFYFYGQTNECNFSILWAILVLVFCIKILWRLTAVYFRSDFSIGERSICIISGSIFLITAMVLLIADENHLEFELESAYRSFNESASAFVNNKTLSSTLINVETRGKSKPVSFLLVKFIIAILCSLTGVVFTFPGLRFGQLQKALMEETESSPLSRTFCTINYLSPLFIIFLWVKPISRDLLTSQEILPMNDNTFDTLRIYCIILLNLFRFYQLPKYMAMFLCGAKNRITRFKRRGGTTTNKEVQVTISSIYNFTNVVAVQYILPILMCLFTAFMYTTMGGYSWIPFSDQTTHVNNTIINDYDLQYEDYNDATGNISTLAIEEIDQIEDALMESNMTLGKSPSEDVYENTAAILSMIDMAEIKKIFSPQVFRGIFGFATWWFHFTWFCTSTIGFVYHTYFLH